MSKIASHAAVAPRLSATSVDFNALHAACLKGDDAAAAFAAANEADYRNGGDQAAPLAPAVPAAARSTRGRTKPGRKTKTDGQAKVPAAAAPPAQSDDEGSKPATDPAQAQDA